MIVRVQVPVEIYHTTHNAVLEALGGRKADGLLCHIGRETEDGFEVIEVWDSKEASGRFNAEVVIPAMIRAGVPMPDAPPQPVEFEPLDVMIGGS